MQRTILSSMFARMNPVFSARFLRIARWCCLMFGAGWGLPAVAAGQPAVAQAQIEVTNVQQLRLLASQTSDAGYAIHLEGDVWWADPAHGRLVLKDDSGAEELEMELQDGFVGAGQRVLLEGNGTITRTGGGFRIGSKGPVVDNDGVHGMVEKAGTVYLEAGRNPIRVDWFNGTENYGLQVEYEGPSLPRQKIPDSALFRIQVDEKTGASNWVGGLNFRCCDAPGEELPDFDRATATRTGTVDNFDLRVTNQVDHVGLSFTGFLEIPASGFYTFHTTSDDGSQLFVGKPSLRAVVIGRAVFPQPRRFLAGEVLRDEEGGQWAEVEGKVIFFSEQSEGAKLELSSGTGRIWAVVASGGPGLSPAALLNKYVRATGFSQPASTIDGQKVLVTLLVPGVNQITVLESHSQAVESPETNSGALPLLVSAAEVHHLKREEAERGYPVKIKGVITSVLPEHQAFTIQDASRGLYVIDFSESRSDPPQIGELMEIEGKTDPSLFAPVVYASRVTSLGAGNLPDPVHPTWDQLINGSMDAQYVEIQGVLTDVLTNGVVLLTRDGLIKSDLRVTGMQLGDLKRYEDALIRIRGCLFATWDGITHKVKVGEIRILGADVTVDQPAPADLFSTPAKTAAELLLFDPQASDLQRVKVSGQIIFTRGTECFMMDGTNGVRFIARQPVDLGTGDLVEVVGFPELSSASPVLREAVAKKTGHAMLPRPKNLDQNKMISADNDSTLVRVKAQLVSQRSAYAGQTLEMRAGLLTFLALLPSGDNQMPDVPVGSLLELTGTYASQGGSRATSRDATSFELLINSPSDIEMLARPPWWTLERLLIILGALACGLAVTVLWITQLHRKVEQRTSELEIQIRERQRVEQQRALEQERARIAQDLHDELGSGLTEISMLGARARPALALDQKRGGYLEQIGEKARQLVSALDEIVWAMNPSHDSVASIVSYFSLYADRFLGLANIAWRLEGPLATDDQAVDSRHRHELFLAFKEALANVVHHSGATEVRFGIKVCDGRIQLSIADNGRGLAEGGRTAAMDGISNMRARLEKLGGRFEMETPSGGGTTVRFQVPSN
jgi:signal transduction histidine kinase